MARESGIHLTRIAGSRNEEDDVDMTLPRNENPASLGKLEVHVTAIVLAGGLSRRMGRDKCLLDFDGEPALARIVRVLRQAGVQRIVVVLPEIRSAVRRAVNLEGVTTAINNETEAGQTRSIRIGLQNLETASEAFLLCPVDVPLFEVADVKALVAAYAQGKESVSSPRIVVPGDGKKRGHPALFSRALAAEFRALSDSEPGNVVLRRDPSRVVHLDLKNPELYADIDDEKDYAAALARRGARA